MVVVEHRQRDGDHRRGAAPRRGARPRSGRHLPGAPAPLQLHGARAERRPAAAEDDVLYAIVLDADGRVAAHSERPERVGLVLPGALDRKAAAATEPARPGDDLRDGRGHSTTSRCRSWSATRSGARCASASRSSAWRRLIRRTRWELGGLTAATLLLGGLAAALVARRISRPVQQLAEGAAAISRGELDLRIEPTTDDEIGAPGRRLQSHDGPAPPAARRTRGRQPASCGSASRSWPISRATPTTSWPR